MTKTMIIIIIIIIISQHSNSNKTVSSSSSSNLQNVNNISATWNLPYLLKYKMSFPLYIWHLNVQGHLKFVHEVLNQMASNWIAQSQTKVCVTKSSCEICSVLGNYTVQSGNSSLMFQHNLSVHL